MPSLREMDILVASRIFNINVIYDENIGDHVDKYTKEPIKKYTEDKEAAALVLEKVTGKKGNVSNCELLIREVLDFYK